MRMRSDNHITIKISKSWKAKSRRQEDGQVRSEVIEGNDDNYERNSSTQHEPNSETDESGSTKREIHVGQHDQHRGWRFFC